MKNTFGTAKLLKRHEKCDNHKVAPASNTRMPCPGFMINTILGDRQFKNIQKPMES